MALLITQAESLFTQIQNHLHQEIENILHPPKEPVNNRRMNKAPRHVVPPPEKTPLPSLVQFNRLLDTLDYGRQLSTDDRVLMENSLKMKKLTHYLQSQRNHDQNQVQVYIQMKLTKNNDFKDFFSSVLDRYTVLNIVSNNLKHRADQVTI